MPFLNNPIRSHFRESKYDLARATTNQRTNEMARHLCNVERGMDLCVTSSFIKKLHHLDIWRQITSSLVIAFSTSISLSFAPFYTYILSILLIPTYIPTLSLSFLYLHPHTLSVYVSLYVCCTSLYLYLSSYLSVLHLSIHLPICCTSL